MNRSRATVRPSVAALSFALFAACATDDGGSSGNGPAQGLAGSSWRLVELQSSDDAIGTVRPDDPAKYELTFGADGRVAMRLDCNRGTGGYAATANSATQGSVTFTPGAMTRAMCLPGSLDTRIARELGFVRTYLLQGDRLTLVMMADGGTQVWTRKTG